MHKPIQILLCLVLGGNASSIAHALPVYRQVAGEIRQAVVEPGDSLFRLAARSGVSWRTLAAENRIADPNRIWPGQVLRTDTRRIVPSVLDDGVVINIPEATLYVFERGNLTARFPVGLGRPHRPTPVGSFTVLFRQTEPNRSYPASLDDELSGEDRMAVRKAPPEPGQSLGPYWIQLSRWGFGIHGTPFSTTLGQFLGEGCVRVGQGSIEDLYRRVREGTRVDIVYEPVKLAVTPNGEIWLESHPDIYGQGVPNSDAVLAAVTQQASGQGTDRQAVEDVLAKHSGLAQRIGTAESGAGGGLPTDTDTMVEARWRCLDCPPGLNRRVTFQIEAQEPIDLPNPFPIEIRDDFGRVVFRPQMVSQTLVHLGEGETRNFVWEVRDMEGQPLPPGSYLAVIRFFYTEQAQRRTQTLSLPLWLGN